MKRTVVVLAGGLGTRVAHVASGALPKALLPVDGRPFIDLKLAELVAAGADDIVLLIGHNAAALTEHLATMGHQRVPVRFLEDGPRLLGTGGAIRHALEDLPERFWVTYGDTLLDVPLPSVENFLASTEFGGVMVVLENVDQWETSNVSVHDDRVVAYERGARPGSHRYIDYGMLLLSRDTFASRADTGPFDLGEVVRDAVDHEQIGAWVVTERFHDIGTETAWRETDDWVRESALWDRLQERIHNREQAGDLPRP